MFEYYCIVSPQEGALFLTLPHPAGFGGADSGLSHIPGLLEAGRAEVSDNAPAFRDEIRFFM
jgi:hypothetical protein